jgi:hypothetical protein
MIVQVLIKARQRIYDMPAVWSICVVKGSVVDWNHNGLYHSFGCCYNFAALVMVVATMVRTAIIVISVVVATLCV